MNTRNDNTDQCKAVLGKERIIKSVLCGGSVGLAAGFVIAFITWFFEFKGMWLAIGVGLGLWAVAAVLFYFFMFKPTARDVMVRVDRAGLDERMITMLELEGDDSVMAKLQRADAQETFSTAVKNSDGALVKMKIPALIIALTCVAGGIAFASVTVTGLSDYGVIPTYAQLKSGDWDGAPSTIENGKLVDVIFEAPSDIEGCVLWSEIDGEQVISTKQIVQTVKTGETASAVKAFVLNTEKSYYLAKWVDESGDEYYNEPLFAPTVTSAKTYTAVFEAIDPDDDIMYSYYYDPNNKDGKRDPNKKPGDENEQPPEEMQSPPDGDPSDGNGAGGGGAGQHDTIIDGSTSYDENFDSYRGEAMGQLTEGGGDMPPELVETIEGYFGAL